MKIVYLGNFGVKFSTESHMRWTWEQLGHQVVALQEGQATTDQVAGACQGSDIFQWSKTHGWETRGSFSVDEMIDKIHHSGVKTMSYHLDFFYGLDQWDRRSSRVGKTADWRLNYVFTTDGGHEEFYRSRGVNHHWLPPAVVEYACHDGQSAPICDVGFSGSVNYHPEYPFRAKLVQALQQHYGPRFRTFQGVREQALNNLYAGVKVWVGDHVFAGTPRYWSDRAPESCGRGAFIVYPRTEGLCIPVATYEPQNVDDLIAKVDYYLAHEDKREQLRRACQAHVQAHDTYTSRLKKVLKVVKGEDLDLRAGQGPAEVAAAAAAVDPAARA